jgi:hypothetical protein
MKQLVQGKIAGISSDSDDPTPDQMKVVPDPPLAMRGSSGSREKVEQFI